MEWAIKATEHDDNKAISTYNEVLLQRISNTKIVLEQLERSNLLASL